jgi:hypothetical protein
MARLPEDGCSADAKKRGSDSLREFAVLQRVWKSGTPDFGVRTITKISGSRRCGQSMQEKQIGGERENPAGMTPAGLPSCEYRATSTNTTSGLFWR